MSDFTSHPDSLSRDAYDRMAEYYRHEVDTKAFNAYYERPATLSLLPVVDGRSVLDAGCAAGWYSEWLAKHGALVTAIDFSYEMFDVARRRLGDKARVIRADLNNQLDFLENGEFDLVLSSLTLHYLKDWHTVLSEFHRILKPDGVLVFSIHHPFMEVREFDKKNYFETELIEDEWEIQGEKLKVSFYSRPLSSITKSLADEGFVIERVLEPMPTKEFQEKDPETYDKLTRNPQFLFFRCRKR